jgi:poly-gamma-glutamate capsule biosynthesis protein CapA/YwtB (metallophosphatase superfamily)
MDAHAPAVVDVSGLHVAFLGCVATPDEGGGFSIRAWEAGPSRPGVALCSDEGIATDVAASRRVADFVVVAIHAGDEYRSTPNATERELASAALAAGADAVIGAHAHVVQPIELPGSQLVAYGLGNFVFALDDVDRANIPVPRVSLVLDVTLTKGAGVTAWRALPVVLDDAQSRPRPASLDEAASLRAVIGPDRP